MYFDVNILTWQMVWSGFVVTVLGYLKKSNLPALSWVNSNTWRVNRTLAVVSSAVVALGIHWNYSYDVAEHGGRLLLEITCLNPSCILEHLKDWGVSYMFQQMGYRMTALDAVKEDA